MIVFGGALALLFYGFLIGTLLPGRRAGGISDYLIGCIAASLWVSWFIAAATILAGASSFFYACFGVSLLFAGFLFVRNFLRHDPNSPRIRIPDGATLALVSVTFGIAAILSINLIFDEAYSPLFNTWDAIVSWNRWAVEIAHGQYQPINGAYPILFPAFWSLIYRAQHDDSVWFLAKASMFVLPVLTALIVTVLVERRKLVEALLTGIFVFSFFYVSRSDVFLDGMMDVPVAVLMLCAGVFTYLAVDNLELERDEEAVADIRLAALFAGLAAITKQPGALSFAPLLVATVFVLGRRRFPLSESIGFLVRCAAPFIIFLIVYSQRQSDPLGNVDYLRTLAAQTPNGQSKLSHAYYWLQNMWQPQMTLLIAALPFASFGRLKSAGGIVGVVFLVSAAVGTLVFADCCSYEPRNGWWILSLLVVGSLFGIREILSGIKWPAQKAPPPSTGGLPRVAVALPAFVVALLAAGLLSSAYPDARVRALQADLQWQLLWPDVNGLVRNNTVGIGDSRIVSSYQVLGWLPDMQDNYVNCWGDDACTISAITSADGGYVLTNDLDSRPQLRQFIGNADYLGEARGWRLYGPIHPAHSAATPSPGNGAQ